MTDFPISPNSSGVESAHHYDTVVEAWGILLEEDLHYGYFHNGYESLVAATDELTNQMLLLAEPRSGMRMLDVGCGTGKAACRIAREHSTHVTGISPSLTCIEKAQLLAEKGGLCDLTDFRDGDGTSLSFGDGQFDRVWVMESSHLMKDKTALIAECARVLRPGGLIVLCDIVVKRKLSLEKVIENRDEFLLLRDVFGRAMMEPLEFYCEQLNHQVLEVISQSDISPATFPTFNRWRQNAQHNREAVSDMIGGRAWEQFFLSCDVLEQFWHEDILGYGIICAKKNA